ncbi:MAG TPA: sugar ABC transporter permease [Eubacteriales bacterium]|nr:sugar ABC transporter permease [Eubacteriales bacterium]
MKKRKQDAGRTFLPVRAVKSWLDGDVFVKLTPLLWGAGYIRRKQYVKGFLALVFEAVVVLFSITYGCPNIAKLGTLGTVKRATVYNPVTMKNEVNQYDNSFLILLFGLVGLLVIAAALIVLLRIVSEARELQQKSERGEPVNSFRDDVRDLFNQRFHITLLSLPSLGIIVFTIIPLLFMILVAFTNYDQQHMAPTELFTWVGLDNFKRLFTTSLSETFGYSFGKVLGWTLVWAFFATFTCYFGGIALSLLINNKRTRVKKLWRTLFVICIAVPQFVSLLLVRNFFADTGIVNTFCANAGITDFLKSIGLVGQYLDHIPFLTEAKWAKVMIVIINFWIGVPYLMLIATGVLMNIPTEYYESAKIDGANALQTFNRITMPFMLSVTGPYLITSFIANINNFNVIYLLTQDVYFTMDTKLAASNAKDIDLLVTWLYRLTNDSYNYKMASVIGILVFLVCAVFTLLAFNYTFRKGREGRFQ